MGSDHPYERTRQASQEQRWDRERDYRKHEPRPGDNIPARLSTEIPTAVDVAALVKQVGIMQGAELIEQYARTVASEARVAAVAETAERICLAIEAPLARTTPVDIIFGETADAS